MLIFRNAVFLHVPKTGGSWVREAVRVARVSFEEYFAYGDPHGDILYCPYPERFKFAFVRHPLSLYSSYWRFKVCQGWDSRNPFDISCAASSFEGFVRNVLRGYLGWCSRMFEDYVGTERQEIEFVGRFERLVDDLVIGLTLAGETFDEAALRGTPPVNRSPILRAQVHWPTDLRREVLKSEADALQRFGYSDAVPLF